VREIDFLSISMFADMSFACGPHSVLSSFLDWLSRDKGLFSTNRVELELVTHPERCASVYNLYVV
jgi:hypothetical protein